MANNARSNVERKAQKHEKKLAAQKAEQKKNRQHKAVVAAIVAVLLICLGLIIGKAVKENIDSGRGTVAASTQNFKVTQAMMNYFFNSTYNSAVNTYTQYGLDESSYSSLVTRDSIMTSTKSQVEEVLSLCEMAKEKGVALDNDDMKEIDEVIESYKESKKGYSSSSVLGVASFDKFLEYIFGKGVNESVVRECLKLTQLSSKYQEELVETFEYTDEQYEDYYKENVDNYRYVDYLTYEFKKAEDAADGSEAKASAEALAAVKTPEEFKDYMKKVFEDEAKAAAEEGAEPDLSGVDAKVEAVAKTKQLKSSLSTDELKDWAFGDGAKVNTVKTVFDDEKGTYAVYMLTATPYRDEEVTKKAAVILLTDGNNGGDAQKKAEEIKAEWDAGEKTEEAFLALSEKYSESAHHHVEDGYTKNTAEIGEWLYADGRAAGDVGIIRSQDDTANYIVYLAGDGLKGWQSSVRSALQNADFEKALKDYQTAHNVGEDAENPSIVNYVEDAMAKVDFTELSSANN